MVNNGFRRKGDQADDGNMAFKYTNDDLVRMTGTTPLRKFIKEQQIKYTAHLCRLPNHDMRKKMLFAKGKKNSRCIWKKFEGLFGKSLDQIQIRNTMMKRERIQDLLSLL